MRICWRGWCSVSGECVFCGAADFLTKKTRLECWSWGRLDAIPLLPVRRCMAQPGVAFVSWSSLALDLLLFVPSWDVWVVRVCGILMISRCASCLVVFFGRPLYRFFFFLMISTRILKSYMVRYSVSYGWFHALCDTMRRKSSVIARRAIVSDNANRPGYEDRHGRCSWRGIGDGE